MSDSPPFVLEQGFRSTTSGPSSGGRGFGCCYCRSSREGGGSQGAWRSLLALGWATPSPGSLVALSRNRCSESDLALTVITVEVQARLLADSLEVQDCPEESVQLPYPSHPG